MRLTACRAGAIVANSEKGGLKFLFAPNLRVDCGSPRTFDARLGVDVTLVVAETEWRSSTTVLQSDRDLIAAMPANLATPVRISNTKRSEAWEDYSAR